MNIDRSFNKNQGWKNNNLINVSSAFIAERRFLRLAMDSISTTQFSSIIKFVRPQLNGGSFSEKELMKQNIKDKLINMNNKQTIALWEQALNEGIVPAVKKLFTYFKK